MVIKNKQYYAIVLQYTLYNIFGSLAFGLCAMTIAACTDDIVDEGHGTGNEAKGDIVQFAAANTQMGITRADGTLYVPNGVRFAVDMYQETGTNAYNFESPAHTYVVVEGNVGNCLYRMKEGSNYRTPTGDLLDDLGNDIDATLYWASRSNHAFIGYVNDYNAALRTANNQKKDGEEDYVPVSLATTPEVETIYDEEYPDDEEKALKRRYYEVNLRNIKDGDTYRWNSMNDQPDPLIAATEKYPQGSSAESNRVFLTFKHQLAQVQVCLKGHESMGEGFDASQIDGVELLGVSETAKIYPFISYKDGVKEYNPNSTDLIHPAVAVPVDLRVYSAEQLDVNKWGTSFSMFPGGTLTYGYLKSYQCITFGTLNAIRIYWRETTYPDSQQHTVTFEVADANFRTLQSGKRYIFNLELRRGTLAVVRTVIDNWIDEPTTYSGNGTIQRH